MSAESTSIYPYYSPDLARATVASRTIERYPQELLNLLDSAALDQAILSGHVTFAMIRPSVGNENNLAGLPEEECVEEVMRRITGLGMISHFSLWLTPETIEEFYGGSKTAMETSTAHDPYRYTNRWDEFMALSQSGPATGILLYDADGDAVSKWRALIGKNIGAYPRVPGTIRGDLGTRLNNLVHGSDAPHSVQRELTIIANCMKEHNAQSSMALEPAYI